MERIAGSFRDPAGEVYQQEDRIFRTINPCYQAHYEKFVASGLKQALEEAGVLIPSRECIPHTGNAWKLLQVTRVPFISYPYEWCYSQLRDAALLTLEIQRIAMKHGMTLKDASGFNIQFLNGKPVLIDLLSFEEYVPGKPWVAYRQFCKHFLAPLALMSYADFRLSGLLRSHIDGIPIDLAARLLPLKACFSPGIFWHLCLHAAVERRSSGKAGIHKAKSASVSKESLESLVDTLSATVRRIKSPFQVTEWADYYDHTNYSAEDQNRKQQVVAEVVERLRPGLVYDLGANTGIMSRIAAKASALVVAADIDHQAVERHYAHCRSSRITNVLPLVFDLSNPSPAIGWDCCERMTLPERGRADLVMALALVHHLVVGNNLTFSMVAEYLAKLGRYCLIEFIPPEDSQFQQLAALRTPQALRYGLDEFQKAFSAMFEFLEVFPLQDGKRSLYLLRALS